MSNETRERRVNMTIADDYLTKLDKQAAADGLEPTRWARVIVERELDTRAAGNTREDVIPAERDLLIGLRFIRRDDPEAYAAVTGFLAICRYSPPARDRLVAMAREFHAAIDSRMSPAPGMPQAGERKQRPGDLRKGRVREP